VDGLQLLEICPIVRACGEALEADEALRLATRTVSPKRVTSVALRSTGVEVERRDATAEHAQRGVAAAVVLRAA